MQLLGSAAVEEGILPGGQVPPPPPPPPVDDHAAVNPEAFIIPSEKNSTSTVVPDE
jgi:hypothetical protein